MQVIGMDGSILRIYAKANINCTHWIEFMYVNVDRTAL